MAPESETNLTAKTFEIILEMISINRGSRDTFLNLAEGSANVSVAIMFRELAAERNQNVAELESYLRDFGTQPKPATPAVTSQGAFSMLRTTPGETTAAMLAEAESAEGEIRQHYEQLLLQEPDAAVRELLIRQHRGIQLAYDRVRTIRDAHRRAS